MPTALFIALSVVVLLAWWVRRRRLRETVEGRSPIVSDELLHEILAGGDLEEEDGEPLDEGEIRAAEDRFWEETEWEEPDEFGG